uniref:Uncharacterized protein n=1 Tax=Nelumbo nucifera TaxID=4432 RepID=A0A822Z889_NELNU|nr:TPA_asm: hypothetical protein HUJ06_013912 [Nelumbo nucifera]
MGNRFDAGKPYRLDARKPYLDDDDDIYATCEILNVKKLAEFTALVTVITLISPSLHGCIIIMY